ncbi:MAG: PD40 domain-containing protein [Anaerolineales bacterium]|nr:PD40 domain-containing protein [Anaerolineales bacterium]
MSTLRVRLIVWVMVVAVLLTAVISLSPPLMNTAFADSPPSPPPLPERTELLPLPGSVAPDSGPEQILAPEQSVHWSKVVFQSYRDYNWNIFVANDDGSSQAKLTTYAGSDVHPDLNRGGTRVVYSSYRNNNYEIYVMNADGSEQTSLTQNSTDDVNPAWSPDSNRIVFQAYRNGQPEIYVMNADGSNPVRLTNDSGYDGYPVWSPDGSKIAFVSNRSGLYRIHVMNADGSDVVSLSSQSYSLYPTWSPDGSKIAYSADSNGDGWLELWMMNADGSGQQLLQIPGSQTDYWAGSWSPDGRYIAYTRVQYVYYQGNWYWTNSYFHTYNVNTQSDNQMMSGSLNWNPNWQTLDNVAPTSSVATLAKTTYVAGFQVEWSGSDDMSGVASYDVQYRLGESGAWVNWQTAVSTTTAQFVATPGTTVSFRSRARDTVYNFEPWSSVPDATTTFYSWDLRGYVTDNRGAALVEMPVTIVPTPLVNSLTDNNGLYQSQLLQPGAHTLDVIRSGYGDVAATVLDMEAVSQIAMPPANDVVENGGFEVLPALSQWQTNGTLPVTVTSQRHTGSQAVILGNQTCPYPCLTNGETPNFPLPMNFPKAMAVDSQGTLHLLWADSNTTHAQRSAAGVWTSEQIGVAYASDLFIAPDDSLYVFFTNGQDIAYSLRSEGGVWSVPQTIATLPVDGYAAQIVSIDMDAQGHFHLLVNAVYSTYPNFTFYVQQSGDNEWQIQEVYSDAVMAVEPNGTRHLAWITRDFGHVELVYQSWLPDGTETIPSSIRQSANLARLEHLQVSANGDIHLVWTETVNYDYGIYHATRTLNGVWSTPVLLYLVSGYYPSNTTNIAVDSQGSVHLIAENYDEVESVYQLWQPETGWQAPVSISSTALPLLVVDRFDRLHVFSYDNNDIYRHSLPATTAGTAVLAQSLAIPADMPYPTLSFMARRPGDIEGDASGLELLVTAGVTTTAVSLSPGNAAWTHYWVDMMPWAGQTVTLTFKLTQTSGDSRVAALLDDISLGSASPDLWIHGDGSSIALPGELATYEIYSGNQGSVEASDVMVTATLPAEMTFVSASLPVTVTGNVLVWALGDLTAVSQAPTLTFTVSISPEAPLMDSLSIPLAVGTSSPEADVANNVGAVATFIGHRVYLPVLMRE